MKKLLIGIFILFSTFSTLQADESVGSIFLESITVEKNKLKNSQLSQIQEQLFIRAELLKARIQRQFDDDDMTINDLDNQIQRLEDIYEASAELFEHFRVLDDTLNDIKIKRLSRKVGIKKARGIITKLKPPLVEYLRLSKEIRRFTPKKIKMVKKSSSEQEVVSEQTEKEVTSEQTGKESLKPSQEEPEETVITGVCEGLPSHSKWISPPGVHPTKGTYESQVKAGDDENNSCKFECADNYDKIGKNCIMNARECIKQNGIGVSRYDGFKWTTCELLECNDGFHTENNFTCSTNTKICSITYGFGELYWNESSWGKCQVTSCVNGYEDVDNSCKRFCSGDEYRNKAGECTKKCGTVITEGDRVNSLRYEVAYFMNNETQVLYEGVDGVIYKKELSNTAFTDGEKVSSVSTTQIALSPDEKFIVYRNGSDRKLYKKEVGSDPGVHGTVLSTIEAFYPKITPDGKYIVYLGDKLKTLYLKSMDDDTPDNGRRLNTNSTYGTGYTLSPDSKYVVYSNVNDWNKLYKKMIDDETQSNGQKITDSRSSEPVISQDGKTLVYINESVRKVFKKDLSDDGVGEAITSVSGENPHISADGSFLVYRSLTDRKLYKKMLSDDGNGEVLTTVNATKPMLSSDGNTLIYQNESRSGSMYQKSFICKEE